MHRIVGKNFAPPCFGGAFIIHFLCRLGCSFGIPSFTILSCFTFPKNLKMLPQIFLQDLGDGLMKLCWTAVNLWKKLKLMVSHLGSLSVWLTVLGQKLMLFGRIKAPLKNFVSMWWHAPLLMIVMWFRRITEQLSNRYNQVMTFLFCLGKIVFDGFFIDSLCYIIILYYFFLCKWNIMPKILMNFANLSKKYTKIFFLLTKKKTKILTKIKIKIFMQWLFSLLENGKFWTRLCFGIFIW